MARARLVVMNPTTQTSGSPFRSNPTSGRAYRSPVERSRDSKFILDIPLANLADKAWQSAQVGASDLISLTKFSSKQLVDLERSGAFGKRHYTQIGEAFWPWKSVEPHVNLIVRRDSGYILQDGADRANKLKAFQTYLDQTIPEDDKLRIQIINRLPHLDTSTLNEIYSLASKPRTSAKTTEALQRPTESVAGEIAALSKSGAKSKWSDLAIRGDRSPSTFIRDEWGPEIANGMRRASLRTLDYPLYTAYGRWISLHPDDVVWKGDGQKQDENIKKMTPEQRQARDRAKDRDRKAEKKQLKP